ncbi:MAG: nucleoside 2-deoxyribosyltransferase [Candidatus Micrarchaeota archaeon]|nr:nucleoside 2-deoxyribosyltransferase [Candidatus Micrarchaeota archaeon]
MHNTKKINVYLASPLGFTAEGRLYIRTELVPKLESMPNVKVLDPWAGLLRMSDPEIMRIPKTMSRQLALKIGGENFKMIERSDVVLACLNGPDPDSGTCIEIGYAYGRQKHIIGYRTDYRLTGESHKIRVNLQVESAILLSGGELFQNLNGAMVRIAMLRK